MAVYNVTRQVQVKEETTLDIEIPAFLTTEEDIRFYVSRFVEADKLLKWEVTQRGANHFFSVSLANPTTALPVTVHDISVAKAQARQNFFSSFRFWSTPNA